MVGTGKRNRQEINDLSSNERLVLDIIWRHEPISRKSLAEITGLTGASTSRLTKRALAVGLIEESVVRSGGVGSPSRPLQRSASAAYSIGVSFSKDSIDLAVADLAGDVKDVHHVPAKGISIERVADALQEAFKKKTLVDTRKHFLLGVGVAVPGYRSRVSGQWAVHWDFPELLEVDIADELSRRIKLPVYAERDAVASLWAERLNGRARKLRDFCLLYLGQGVGGAVMSDDRLLLGKHGNAGGLGSLFPYEQPRPTLDHLTKFLSKHRLKPSQLDKPSKKAVRLLAEWVDLVLPSLDHGLEYISRLYDPDTIILSGSLPRSVLNLLAKSSSISEHIDNYTADLGVPNFAVTGMDDEHRLLASATALPLASILHDRTVDA